MNEPAALTFLKNGPVDVAVIVVTFRSALVIDGLIRSLRGSFDVSRLSVTVVDNGSDDETCEVVSLHNDVTLVCSNNAGYAAGINRGLWASPTYDVALIVNPDLQVESTAIRELLDVLRTTPDVGVAVPLLVDDAGERTFSLRNEPGVLRALGDAVLGARWKARPEWLGEIVYESERYFREGRVDWATGAAMAISRQCVDEVGDWDDDTFFLYSEETDFCRRARDAGFGVVVAPRATARHSGGGSGTSPTLDGILALSRVRYVDKHRGRVAATGVWLAAVVGHLLRIRRPGGIARLKIVLSAGSYWRTVETRLGGTRADHDLAVRT